MPPSRLRPNALPHARGYARRSPEGTANRHYVTPAGPLPSVTTVLGATSEGKAALEAWKKRPGSAGVGETARRRGTWTHTQIERWILGEPPQRSFPFGAYWRNVAPWLEAHFVEAVAIETAVWHPAGFSGTFDALGYAAWGTPTLHDALTIFDWKTAAKPRTGALLEDYFTQLGAYRAAVRHTFGLTALRGILVIARPHANGPDVFEVAPAALDVYEAAFMQRLSAYYAMPDTAAAPFSVE